MAVAVAPGNPEVLTLVGNLHLSLCDWAPAQNVFDQLLLQKGKSLFLVLLCHKQATCSNASFLEIGMILKSPEG